MSMQNLLDDKLHVSAIVHVSKNRVDFVSLRLDQIYGDHYRFSVTLDYDVLDKSFMGSPEKQFQLLNNPVTIQIQHGDDIANAYTFDGIITNVKNTGKEGKHGYIILEGASPTIMLEQGKRMEVYSDMSLSKIFDEVSSRANPQYLQKSNSPALAANVDFLMQYNESDWNFLRRISYLYGENLFYSGNELLFGDYTDWNPVPMVYDKEIVSYEFCSRLLPNTFVNYQYLAEEDTILEKNSPDSVTGANAYINVASERSQDLTEIKSPKVPLEVPVGDKSTLDEIVDRKKSRTAAQTVVLIAEAKTYEACVGRLVDISLAEGISTKQSLGTYRVIKSTHIIDQNHRYKNYFEAVPSTLKTMPVPEIDMPLVHSIVATVRDNADPKGLGRIQVDFPFASNHSHSWLRVMSPDAGASDKVSKSRGMMFIPEVGDQVMVGFEFSDPNRPYVMGSMFHGKNTGGGGDGNKTKSLSTRNGSTVTLDEEQGNIFIADQTGGNFIVIDGKDKISIVTAKTIELNNGKACIVLEDENIIIKAKNVLVDGEDCVAVCSGGEDAKNQGITVTQSGDANVSVIGPKVIVGATETMAVSAANNLDMTSNAVTLNGDRSLDVTSGLVKINS